MRNRARRRSVVPTRSWSWASIGSRSVGVASPDGLSHAVVEHLDRLTAQGREHLLGPTLCAGQRLGEGVEWEPPPVGTLERVRSKGAADGSALEHQRVEGDAGHADPQTIEDGDQPLHLYLDPGLLFDLLDHHLCRRIANVRPPGGIEPDPRIGPLDQEHLVLAVAHRSPDGHLGGHVAGDALAHCGEPLLDQTVGVLRTLDALVGGDADVGGDAEDLLESLLLIEGFRKGETGPGDCRQRLAPPEELFGGGNGFHVSDATAPAPTGRVRNPESCHHPRRQPAEAIRWLRDRTEAAIRFMPIYRHSEIPLAAG